MADLRSRSLDSQIRSSPAERRRVARAFLVRSDEQARAGRSGAGPRAEAGTGRFPMRDFSDVSARGEKGSFSRVSSAGEAVAGPPSATEGGRPSSQRSLSGRRPPSICLRHLPPQGGREGKVPGFTRRSPEGEGARFRFASRSVNPAARPESHHANRGCPSRSTEPAAGSRSSASPDLCPARRRSAS